MSSAIYNIEARILVVDDTEHNRMLLARSLSNNGYQVLTAEDGPQAIALLGNERVDLILLDIMMPVMDGYEVCRILKENPETTEIPILFISALSDVNDIARAFESGGVDYITKPFKFREVQARVETHLTLVRQKLALQIVRERELEQQAKINAMRNQFISNATHDLKNPIGVVMGYSSLMADHPDELVRNFVVKIQRSAEKMQNLVMDMLDLLQFEGGQNLQKSMVDLVYLLKASSEDYRFSAAQKKVAYEFIAIDDEVFVSVDHFRITRALDNLVSNAIKYTVAGGCVTVTTGQSESHVWVEVKDTGLGIPEAALPHLFDSFYRVEEEEHYKIEGTGLGLAIVKSIIDQHGGHIDVDSQLGVGSTFRISLPR